MPVNAWNWYRSVSTGTDHKCWSGDNPQVRMVIKQSYKLTTEKFLLKLLKRV